MRNWNWRRASMNGIDLDIAHSATKLYDAHIRLARESINRDLRNTLDPFLNFISHMRNHLRHKKSKFREDIQKHDQHGNCSFFPGEENFGFLERKRNRNPTAHLHSLAEVFSFTLLSYDGLVYFAGGDIMVSGESGIHEALIVPEIQVCLAAVVQDKHFAVLEGGHSSSIDIDVRVDLDARYAPTSGLE